MVNLQKLKRKINRFWHTLGPGLVTGASDDDPSAITTYSQAGANFGPATLWTAIIAYPLLASIQEMCARIGIVNKKTLPGIVKNYYPRWLLYMLLIISCPAFLLNIGADIAGMGAVANLVYPSIPPFIFSIFFAALLITLLVVMPYRKIEQVMKLVCLSLLIYTIVPFWATQDWKLILKNTFFPTIIIDKSFLLVLTGLIGSILSPYVFFWQTSMEVEDMEIMNKKIVHSKYIFLRMRADILFGSFFAVLIMYFIMLAAGTVLHQQHIKEINTVQDAAVALKPLAGNFTYLLFSIGIIGTGFLIIPVLSATVSYILAEIFDWEKGLNKNFSEAKHFYSVIIMATVIGLLLNILDLSPVKMLLYTTELYGITAPILIGIILHICNNKKIMGKQANGRLANFLGLTTLLLTLVVVLSFFIF
ncbi:MAG TPA: divalent metal cation transporter [Puia sp.]|nr:divalent metal cation transporter [Puia sp.]